MAEIYLAQKRMNGDLAQNALNAGILCKIIWHNILHLAQNAESGGRVGC